MLVAVFVTLLNKHILEVTVLNNLFVQYSLLQASSYEFFACFHDVIHTSSHGSGVDLCYLAKILRHRTPQIKNVRNIIKWNFKCKTISNNEHGKWKYQFREREAGPKGRKTIERCQNHKEKKKK